MADLQDFIEDITTNKLSFCAVCFRTEKERKIVPPVALSNFIKHTALDQLSEADAACAYCERQAAQALRLLGALSFARRVARVLRALLARERMTARGAAYLLPGKIRGQLTGPSSVKRNKLMSSLRRYQTYTQTDVLVVDASQSEFDIKNSEILIIDDDEFKTPQKNAPRLVPIEKLLQPQPAKEPQRPIDNNIPVLFPVKQGNSDQILILTGNDLNLNNSVPLILPNGSMVAVTQPAHNQILLPIVNNNIQNHSVAYNKDFVRVNTVDAAEEIILPDKTKQGEKVSSNVVSPKKATIYVDNVNKNESLDRTADSSQGGDRICQITDPRSLHDVRILPKTKKSDRNIDWEDKIPMDVISFMETGKNYPATPSKPPTPQHTPTLSIVPIQASVAAEVSVTSGPSKSPTDQSPIITKRFVPKVVPHTVIAKNPSFSNRMLTPLIVNNTTTSPTSLNHSLALFKPANRQTGTRKRKSKDDDDIIIVS